MSRDNQPPRAVPAEERTDIKVWMEADGAFDRRDVDPAKNYGIHGVELSFYLVGDKGGVQFKFNTGWLLPETVGVETPFDWRSMGSHDYARAMHGRDTANMFPMVVDLGYHSPRPLYEGQTLLTEDCPIIDGPCYYDGSGLNAEPVFEVFLREGSPGVWQALANYYDETFARPIVGEPS